MKQNNSLDATNKRYSNHHLVLILQTRVISQSFVEESLPLPMMKYPKMLSKNFFPPFAEWMEIIFCYGSTVSFFFSPFTYFDKFSLHKNVVTFGEREVFLTVDKSKFRCSDIFWLHERIGIVEARADYFWNEVIF